MFATNSIVYAVTATGGATILNRISNAPSAVDPLLDRGNRQNVCVIWCGVNGSTSAATAWSQLQTYCAARRAAGWKVVLCSEIDAQDAVSNANGWHTTVWPALNTLIQADWASHADALADLGADARLQNANDTTYFSSDKIHLITAGNNVVAEIVADAVKTIPIP